MNASILAFLRKQGHTDDDVLDALRALASGLPRCNTQDAIDICIADIEENVTMRELQRDEPDRGYVSSSADNLPAFITREPML